MILCKTRFGSMHLNISMGLGNRLFPWARCVLFRKFHNIPMVDPIWFRPAIGQLFRGGWTTKAILGKLLLWTFLGKI